MGFLSILEGVGLFPSGLLALGRSQQCHRTVPCMRCVVFLQLLLFFSCSVVSDSFVTPWTVVRQTPLSGDLPGKNAILERVAISFSRGSSWLRDRTLISWEALSCSCSLDFSLYTWLPAVCAVLVHDFLWFYLSWGILEFFKYINLCLSPNVENSGNYFFKYSFLPYPFLCFLWFLLHRCWYFDTIQYYRDPLCSFNLFPTPSFSDWINSIDIPSSLLIYFPPSFHFSVSLIQLTIRLCMCVLSHFSCVWLSVTPWTVA